MATEINPHVQQWLEQQNRRLAFLSRTILAQGKQLARDYDDGRIKEITKPIDALAVLLLKSNQSSNNLKNLASSYAKSLPSQARKSFWNRLESWYQAIPSPGDIGIPRLQFKVAASPGNRIHMLVFTSVAEGSTENPQILLGPRIPNSFIYMKISEKTESGPDHRLVIRRQDIEHDTSVFQQDFDLTAGATYIFTHQDNLSVFDQTVTASPQTDGMPTLSAVELGRT